MKKSFEIIRDLREDHDLKQSDIAAILQTTQQQYSKYETGKVDPPIHCFSMLADFYQVSVDYLLGRTACEMVWMHTKSPYWRIMLLTTWLPMYFH